LQGAGILGFDDYAARVPNLSFHYSNTGRQIARSFQIRGIYGVDTSALYLGDTAIPTSVDPRVLDIERIEVQRGPQGALFGSRAMGGVVQLIPSQPKIGTTASSGHAGLAWGAGGSQVRTLDATLNRPLAETAAVRLTAYAIDEGGFIARRVDPDASDLIRSPGATGFASGNEWSHARINRDRTVGGNLSLFVAPNETLSLQPRVIAQQTRSEGPPYVDNRVDNLVKLRQFDQAETGRDNWSLASLEVKADLAVGQVVSSTSYFRRDTVDVEDSTPYFASQLGGPVLTAVAAPSTTTSQNTDRRLTQEIRLLSPEGLNNTYIVGLFVQRISSSNTMPPESRFEAGSPGIGLFGIQAGDSFYSLASTRRQTEWGLFGEWSHRLSPGLTVTAGGRAFEIQRRQTRAEAGVLFNKIAGISLSPYGGAHRDRGFNPRLALSWSRTTEHSLYAVASKGFRPGIVNDSKGACAALGRPDVPDSVAADSLWSHELGSKLALADGSFSLNMALFDVDWRGRQTQAFDCKLGFGARANVGAARSQGFELEAQGQLNSELSANLALGYTNARITDAGGVVGVQVGDRLPNAPRVNAVVALEYSTPMTALANWGLLTGDQMIFAKADLRYVGESVSAQRLRRPAYSLLDLRLGLRRPAWDVSLAVKNAGDTRANLSDAPELSDALNLVAINRPRTIGLDLRVRY
jgi:outer membrane receptor protein involved in Fe transport